MIFRIFIKILLNLIHKYKYIKTWINKQLFKIDMIKKLFLNF